MLRKISQPSRFAKKYPPEINILGWPKIVNDVLAKAAIFRSTMSICFCGHRSTFRRSKCHAGNAIPMHKNAYDHGEMGLHRLRLHPDGAARRSGEGKIKRGDTSFYVPPAAA